MPQPSKAASVGGSEVGAFEDVFRSEHVFVGASPVVREVLTFDRVLIRPLPC